MAGLLRCLAGLVVILWSALPVLAFNVPEMDTQKFPVEMNGDYLEYRTKATQVVTKGRSFIAYKDMRIAADVIQANTKSEDIFAYGNVDFWKGYDQTKGDFMVYNMKTGKGWMRNASIRRNRNFFRAKDVYVSPSYSLAHDIMQTTCDNVEHPHYRIVSKAIEIVPGHEMTLEGLALKWKGKTLYRKGIDRSSLFKKDDKFFTTRQGMSKIDGIFFKLSSDLMVTPQITGRFGLDYFELRGTGTSFSGTFNSEEWGNGSINLYDLNESKRNHKNTQLSLSHNFRFQRGDSISTNVSYTGDKQGGQAENKDLNVQMNITPILPPLTMNVTASKFFDLDGDKYTLDNGYQILNRLPEINFSFPAYTFPLLPITMSNSGMFGRYEEGTLDDKKNTEKKDVRSNFTVPTVKVNDRFEFTPSYNFAKSWYSEGTERESGNTMVRANHKFSAMTNLEFNYNLATQKGKSPFRFDSFSSTDVMSFRLRVATSTWTFNPINFNYNRSGGRLEQVYWDFSRRSRAEGYHNWEVFLRRDYVPDPVPFSRMNFSRLTPGNFNARYRIASALWSLDTSIIYPHEFRRITNASINYRTIIRPQWQISTNANYNTMTRKFSPFSLSLIRDLHCWEARAEYNHERQEFWLEFYLKAYPEDSGRFRYGADTKRLEAKLAAYDQMTQRYNELRGQ